MKRRELLVRVGGFLVAVPAALHVVACGGDDDDDGGGADAGGGTNSFEGTNDESQTAHPHSFTIQCSDLSSSSDVTYTATGSGHTHTVVLTAAQLADLDAGSSVTVDTNDTHPHRWVINKPSNAC